MHRPTYVYTYMQCRAYIHNIGLRSYIQTHISIKYAYAYILLININITIDLLMRFLNVF